MVERTRASRVGRTKQQTRPAPKSPMRKRQRTRTQQQNAEKLLDAMVAETIEFGLDNLQSGRVAKAAGLTTGALYSRYENADEMLIALWQHRVCVPFLQHLRDVVGYVQGTLPLHHPVTRAVEKPTPLLRLGAEFLVVAQRNDTLSEVITPAIVATLDDLGLNEHTDPLAGAVIMVGASAGLGTIFRSFISSTNPGWGASLTSLRTAAERATPQQFTAPRGDIAPEPINTGNPVRDDLLTSAKRVVARVGFKNATVTRIARRAGFSTSAIYQLWPDKETMLDEAINAVLVLDYGQSSRAKSAALTENRADFGFTDSWYFGMMPARRARLDFRLECIIASRHRSATRSELQKFTRSADSILQSMFPKIPHAITAQIAATEQALGYGFVALTKYFPQPQRLDYFSLMSALARVTRLA